jgi:signal transduction histidine kinase
VAERWEGDVRQGKILVVDDEPFFREEAVAYLAGHADAHGGWNVSDVAGGREALARLEDDPCDVMLLDINMPDLDGMAVLGEMQNRRLLEQTYVIMLSAYGVYDNVVAAMRGGAKDFVNKSEPLSQWIVRIERGFEWQELRRRKQQLEDELRLLAREVGHDIGGSTYFVLTQRVKSLAELASGDPQAERSVEIIEQILGRIKRLADDLGHVAVALDSSEIWRWERIDLRSMLARLAEEFRFGNPGVTVVEQWGEDVPAIHGSRAQLERVFYNLLTNAGRAMPDGGTLTLRTRPAGGGQVAIDVEDTGVGIPKVSREKLFRIGFSDWRNGTKGSGLGLYVVRTNVENHGGSIEVSPAGEAGGTRFTVFLPEGTASVGSARSG